MDRSTDTTDSTGPRDRGVGPQGGPAGDLKFQALYFRDLATGLALLNDGTVVRFIYEGPRGGGNAFTMRVYEVDVKDERSASAAMFNAV